MMWRGYLSKAPHLDLSLWRFIAMDQSSRSRCGAGRSQVLLSKMLSMVLRRSPRSLLVAPSVPTPLLFVGRAGFVRAVGTHSPVRNGGDFSASLSVGLSVGFVADSSVGFPDGFSFQYLVVRSARSTGMELSMRLRSRAVSSPAWKRSTMSSGRLNRFSKI